MIGKRARDRGGNTAIAKPSELTPMTAYLLARFAAKPACELGGNIVHGTGPKSSPRLQPIRISVAISFMASP